MQHKVLTALAAVSLATMTLATAGDRDRESFSRAAADAWSRARSTGADVAALAADPVTASSVIVTNAANTPVVGLLSLSDGTGAMAWGNTVGVAAEPGIKGLMAVSTDGAGFLTVRSSSGATAFMLNGNSGLQSGAGDLAEAFLGPQGGLEPGTVVVIDPARAGAMRESTRAYDRLVAGVVPGANQYKSAITLRGLADLPDPVAVTLTGTVYCKVVGPIRAGDLLTTSSVPGHAMRASDLGQAQGALLGKALQDMPGERGTVLILASLQ